MKSVFSKFLLHLFLLSFSFAATAQDGFNDGQAHSSKRIPLWFSWRNVYKPFSPTEAQIDTSHTLICNTMTAESSHNIDGLAFTNAFIGKYKLRHLDKKQIQKAQYKYTAFKDKCPTHIIFYLNTRLSLSLNGVLITQQAEKEAALSKIKETDIVSIRIKKPLILGIKGNYGQMVIQTKE
jgi:hypothetical protein